jgi:hypothetical protein
MNIEKTYVNSSNLSRYDANIKSIIPSVSVSGNSLVITYPSVNSNNSNSGSNNSGN